VRAGALAWPAKPVTAAWRHPPPWEVPLRPPVVVVAVLALMALLVGCAAQAQQPTGVPTSVVAPPPTRVAPTVPTPMASVQPGPLRALVTVPRGAWSVAVAPRLRRAYVTSRESDVVSYVDLEQNRVVQAVTVGPDPHNLVVDEDAGRVYVTLHGGTSTLRGDAVAVLDALDGSVIAKWPTGPFPAQIDIDPGLGRLYVVNEGDSTVSVLDTADGSLVRHVKMPGQAMDVAASTGSGRAYVTTWLGAGLVAIDGRTAEVVAQTPLGQMPLRVAVNSRTERVYAADGQAPGADRGELWTVEGRTGATASRPLGALPLAVAADPEGDEVLVADARMGTLAVLDGTGQELRWLGAVGAAPHTVVASRALGRAYIVLSGQNALGVLDWPPGGR
jgi:YVTN family beta-propeller protein